MKKPKIIFDGALSVIRCLHELENSKALFIPYFSFPSHWILLILSGHYTALKMRFSIKDFFSKCDQIRNFLQIWSNLLEKSLMEKFIFCAVLSKTFTT